MNTKRRNYFQRCFHLFTLFVCTVDFPLQGQGCGPFAEWQTSEYALPYPVGKTYAVVQANCSGFGHSNFYEYGYDFALPIGSEVTASRPGFVFAIRDGRQNGDIGLGRENWVKVIHSDGTIAAYSHLSPGIPVARGDQIDIGQVLGYSGNTGNTGGFPHLHLHLSTCSEPTDGCGTIPVTFYNTRANSQGLQSHNDYSNLTDLYRAMPYSSDTRVLVGGAGHSPEIWRNLLHSHEVRYDQILLVGKSAIVTPDEGKVIRLVYLDPDGDLVRVELVGDGTLGIELESNSLIFRNFAEKYNQLIRYSKGHARLVIEGTTEDTYLSVYALGPFNSKDPSMFPLDQVYDGWADLASIRITGTGMGGLYLGNTRFSGSDGLVGIDATGVPIHGRVAIGGISASGNAEPAILLGEGSTLAWDDGAVLVASSALEQPNGSSIQTSGFESMLSIASRDSNGSVLSAKVVEAGFEDTQGEVVDIALSLDADQSEAKLSAPFVSELLGGGFGGSPQLSLVADQTYGKQAIVLSAMAPSSRVPLQLSVASGHARINGDTLALTGAGEVVVRATLPKTAFSEAVIVERSFEVSEIPDPYGDPDGDGISSIAETALGMDVSVPDREVLPVFSIEGSSMLVSFRRNRTDFQYVVEASENLETWSDEDVVFEELGGVTRAEAPTLGGSEGKRFLRLRVEK